MKSGEIFLAIEDFRIRFCGERKKHSSLESRMERRKPYKLVCERIEELCQDEEDVRFFIGLAHLKFGDPVENMWEFLRKKTPHSLKKELYLRTEADILAMERFKEVEGLSEKDLFNAPVCGKSLIYNMTRTLTITPWCCLYHLKAMDGPFQPREVTIFDVVKEITHAEKPH